MTKTPEVKSMSLHLQTLRMISFLAMAQGSPMENDPFSLIVYYDGTFMGQHIMPGTWRNSEYGLEHICSWSLDPGKFHCPDRVSLSLSRLHIASESLGKCEGYRVVTGGCVGTQGTKDWVRLPWDTRALKKD